MLGRWVEDPNSEAFKYHLARIPDFFWIAEDGAKCQVSIYISKLSLASLLHKQNEN